MLLQRTLMPLVLLIGFSLGLRCPVPGPRCRRRRPRKGKATFSCLLYGFAFLGGQVVGYNLTDRPYTWCVRRGSTGAVVASGQADVHETFGANIDAQADVYVVEAGGPAVVDGLLLPGDPGPAPAGRVRPGCPVAPARPVARREVSSSLWRHPSIPSTAPSRLSPAPPIQAGPQALSAQNNPRPVFSTPRSTCTYVLCGIARRYRPRRRARR